MKLSELINFYSPWNRQKTNGFGVISEEWKLINLLKWNLAMLYKESVKYKTKTVKNYVENFNYKVW